MFLKKIAQTVALSGLASAGIFTLGSSAEALEICLGDLCVIPNGRPILERVINDKPEDDNQSSSTETAQDSSVSLRPLHLYWHPTREDNSTVVTPEAMQWQIRSGYDYANLEGCVLTEPQAGTRPLELMWSARKEDNITSSREEARRWHKNNGYGSGGIQGYVFTTQQDGTVPLHLYWHEGRQDNATVSTEEAVRWQQNSGYEHAAVEGYIYPPSRCN